MTLQLDYRGKCIFVTDATGGLGRRIAEGFHRLGATVAINGMSGATVQQTIKEMGSDSRLISAPADLTKISEIQSAVERAIATMTRLDVLVCSTARGDLCCIDNVTSEYWEAVLAVNLKSAFFMAQACAPALKKSQGCIVNVASVIGLLGGPAGAAVYSTAKGAMVHLSRMMALELAADGVRVNTVCPGWVDPRVPGSSADSESLNAYIARRSPLQRTATMEECTDAVVYLASSVASYTTGATLVTDGGLTSGHYLS
jgi:meso-butanediol dehydrogenase / (S,S)-butanediol dehydrogenase / diacetyl reductase